MTEQIADSEASVTTVVARVVSYPIKQVWAELMTPQGQAALLGEGGMLGDKGDRWKAENGTWGVTRSYHPMEEIRFSWHKDETAPKTWVDVTLSAQGAAETKIQITHDHANVDLDIAKLTQHWRGALQRIAQSLKG